MHNVETTLNCVMFWWQSFSLALSPNSSSKVYLIPPKICLFKQLISDILSLTFWHLLNVFTQLCNVTFEWFRGQNFIKKLYNYIVVTLFPSPLSGKLFPEGRLPGSHLLRLHLPPQPSDEEGRPLDPLSSSRTNQRMRMKFVLWENYSSCTRML